MRELLDELNRVIRLGQPVVYTVLVETRGSTPQKPGAAMLVFEDGSQFGTLGGGCVEADVKRRALQLLDNGSREILSFQLDHQSGWDDGLICGGRMKMLVDPIRPGDDVSYFETFQAQLTAGIGCTEAVIFEAVDSDASGAVGDRFLFDRQGEMIACRCVEFGDTESEKTITAIPSILQSELRSLEQRRRPYVSQGIAFLPVMKQCKLVIVGGGHVGQMVAEFAGQSGFEIWVTDDREQYCSPERFPRAKQLIVAEIDDAVSQIDFDENTFCIIVTRGHSQDGVALSLIAKTAAYYVGMIGSKRKIKLIFEELLRTGIPRDALQRVHAPLGFQIGSQTVPEIAVSIVAELIAYRNLETLPAAYHKKSLVDDIRIT